MKKLLYIALIGLLTFSCTSRKEQQKAEDDTTSTIDSLKRALNQSQNESNDLMQTIEQIQEGFRQINEAEGIVNVTNEEGDGRQTIIDNMNLIEQKMRLNRELITNLQQQLRTSSKSNSKFKKTMEEMVKNLQQQLDEKETQINDLKKQLEDRDIRIAEQAEQIDNLNEDVNILNTQNEEKAKQMAEQEKELNKAFYVFGTKKELQQQKILNDGAVLRNNDYNKDYFTEIDMRVTKVIKLYSKKATMLTNHPADSYSLDKDTQGQYTLRITNPQNFWSTSKYLVIMVK